MTYDELYRNNENYFSAEPVKLLKDYWPLIEKSKPVLDIGAGQGRNTIFLARQGLEVHAIDPSIVAVETISRVASDEDLKVIAKHCGFEDFAPEIESYSGILLLGLIQILSWAQIETLLARVNAWTDKGSLVFISAWSIADPSYSRISHDWEKCGKNSFKKESGEFHTYLEPDEILTLFHSFEVVHHWEGLGPWHSHGDRPPERHSRVAAVLRR
jgi:cyclopropane fatty-acyl-phospholipid synthase-like methyltransferase